MFDRESATQVKGWIQDALFMMAVSNSCMNPFVYGAYAMNFRQEFVRCVGCACCRKAKNDRILIGTFAPNLIDGLDVESTTVYILNSHRV